VGKRLQDPEGKTIGDKVDRCDLCSGELKPGETTLELWRGEQLVVIRDLPADVCQQCQEAYLSAEVSEKLDRFMDRRQLSQAERYLTVPLYSAAQVLKGG
jgi:YgiT-type zinc finger domain-containing protein